MHKKVYFKLDKNGNFLSQCCGNLLNTDNKKTRLLILESLKYWMTNYHIDGFRFDQAHLLSAETAKLIYKELKKINPNVIIYGEAWDNRNKEFIRRHIGPSSEEQKKMLAYLGYDSLDKFIKKIVPEKILEKNPLKINSPISEHDALQQIKQM